MSGPDDPRGMIASGILRANETGLLRNIPPHGNVDYEEALKVADHVLRTLDAWDCVVIERKRR